MRQPLHTPLPEVPHVVPRQPAGRPEDGEPASGAGSWRVCGGGRCGVDDGPAEELAPFLDDGERRETTGSVATARSCA